MLLRKVMLFIFSVAVMNMTVLDVRAEKGQGEKRDMVDKIEKVVFAGGCFWCMEKPFEAIEGVSEVLSGYSGGHVDNPTYEQVSAGGTGHYEVIEVSYDPAKVTYAQLLEVFWRNVDPHDARGQFCDKGDQYRAAIFVANDEQRVLAEASKEKLLKSGQLKAEIVTEILLAQRFYPAEDYHQNYYKRNPIRYNYYRYRCGRDERLKAVWGE